MIYDACWIVGEYDGWRWMATVDDNERWTVQNMENDEGSR